MSENERAGGGTAAPVETRQLTPGAVTTGLHLGLSREEMNLAALAHGSILVTVLLGLATGGLAALLGIAIPAVLWYAYREKSAYVAEQARQATLYQLAGFVALLLLVVGGALLLVVGWTASALLVLVLVGILLLPIMLIVTILLVVGVVALPIALLGYGLYAAAEAYRGRPFRYRWISELAARYQAQA